MVVCKRVYYQGRVQGVGFRYTTKQLAADYPVAGSVRNLVDGRVELLAEGEANVVDTFLGALSRKMTRYIDNIRMEDLPPQGFTDFAIEH